MVLIYPPTPGFTFQVFSECYPVSPLEWPVRPFRISFPHWLKTLVTPLTSILKPHGHGNIYGHSYNERVVAFSKRGEKILSSCVVTTHHRFARALLICEWCAPSNGRSTHKMTKCFTVQSVFVSKSTFKLQYT